MGRPWMPLYVGDYLSDTAHLTCEQHGAYLLLIMHYWKTGGLPDDEAILKQICRLQGQVGENKWRSICKAIAPLFLPGWKHKRIDEELARAEIISTKRKIAGLKGGRGNRNLNNWQRTNGAADKAIAKQADGQSQRKIEERGQQESKSGNQRLISSTLEEVVRQKGWIT